MDNKPFEIEVTYVVRINSLKSFVKDVKAAVLQIQSLPSDTALRNTALKIFEDALNNAVVEVTNSNNEAAKTVKEKLAEGEPVPVNELEN